jgi:hypothetical protein
LEIKAMVYYDIYVVDRGAGIKKTLHYRSLEKANAFMDSVCGEGEIIENTGRGGTRVKHLDGTSHYMYPEQMTFEDGDPDGEN